MTIGFPFWSSKHLTTDDKVYDFTPEYNDAGKKFNFHNSAGLRFEAQHVRECLLKGLKESPVMSLEHTLTAAEIMEEVRKQVGVKYPQDD